MVSEQYSSMRPIGVRRFHWILAIAWTVTVGTSLGWNVIRVHDGVEDAARTQARAMLEKDLIYRRWNAGHGGVYVPVTEETPPNPYLAHLPERDLTTPSGRSLTLINPAYMTHQVHESDQEHSRVRGHLTSLNPIRPGNKPDPWEAQALGAFERGETEVSSVSTVEGEAYLRLMRPLIAEQSCRECHAAQGYQVDSIRGGISASVPMTP